jgi:predicted permease
MLLFSAIFIWMIVMTFRTSQEASLWKSLGSFGNNPWAVATLWDAYFGFLTFFIWVAYKERSAGARIVWFVLIMALGNIAMSLYVVIQLSRLKENEPLEKILLRNR